jgi:hypothetical protein
MTPIERHFWQWKASPHVWVTRHLNNCMIARREVTVGLLRPSLLKPVLKREIPLATAWRHFSKPVLP